jgi:hypothetical protein
VQKTLKNTASRSAIQRAQPHFRGTIVTQIAAVVEKPGRQSSYYGSISTDIAQDFSIAVGAGNYPALTIPNGAQFLFVRQTKASTILQFIQGLRGDLHVKSYELGLGPDRECS